MRDIWSTRCRRQRGNWSRAWAWFSRAGGVGQDWNPQAHTAFDLGMIIEMQTRWASMPSAGKAIDFSPPGMGFGSPRAYLPT